MYSEKIEGLIKAALADGVLTEKEKQILFRKAEDEGIDLDEFEMVLDARLVELEKKEKEKAQKSAPKSDKFGDVRKCPACGAIVSSGMASCVECGYAFTDAASTIAMDQLAAKLEEIDHQYSSNLIPDLFGNRHLKRCAAKMQAIQTFNVPNTRAELLGLLTTIQDLADPHGPKNGAKTTVEEDLSYAYFLLYNNCIKKAKISFSSDKTFAPFYAKYEELMIKQNKFHLSYQAKIFIGAIIGFVAIIAFCLLMTIIYA